PLEQMQCAGTEARSDLYSAAATLYHLMTGALPVDALTRAGATIKTQPDPLKPAHLAHAQVPAAVGKVIQRAMSQNSALRHATAAELRAALRQAAGLAQATPARTPAAVLFAERPTPARDATERSSFDHAAPNANALNASALNVNALNADASHYSLDAAASHYSLDADAALSSFDLEARPGASAPNASQPSSGAASRFSERGSQFSGGGSQASSGAASQSSFDPTVLEPSEQAHASLRDVHESRAGSRPGRRRNSETRVASRRAHAQEDAPRMPAAKMIGVGVVALLLACAAAGFVLVRRSGASANASETQAVAPSDATTGATGDTGVESQRTNSPAQSSSAPAAAQDAPTDFGREARTGVDTSAPNTQSASGVAEASGDYTNGGSSAAQTGASNTVSPADSTSGDKSGLVIRSAADPGARAAAIEAEVDARQKQEAQSRAAQQAAPPAGDGRRPPPPDGHRPPPPGGHPPPRFPPPRP
ncbi:MAG TPA: hypothetical protein VFX96_10310, partial [Pyrinomonadaceae bacterium]|nr:hypothetical protein [Pyrinomonadaceae bacterium]